MAKSFKKLISEVAEPKSAGERAFVDQHAIQRFDAQPAGQDFIFNGDQPPKKRLADYMKGADAAAYDKAYDTNDGDDSIVDMPESVEELEENPAEEKPMMMGQLRAMAHYIQGIARYVSSNDDPEEWYQNKLAGVSKEMQTLYGYATAETMSMGEETTCPKCDGEGCDHCGGDGTHENAFVAKAAAEKLKGKTKMVMANKEYPVTMKKDNAEKISAAIKKESVQLDELTAAEKKLVDQMYDKKGNLTPLGKKVMDHGKKVDMKEAAPKISKGKAKGNISATGLRGKGMKKFDVDVAVVDGKFEFKITDESGRFQTVNMKKAASMLESVDMDESLEEAKKPAPPKAPKRKLSLKQMRQALDSQDERGVKKKKVSLKKAPWESTELEEKVTIKPSTLSLDSGEKVKVSTQDAKLLTQFFKDLNPRNSKEMHKVLSKDKDGYNEILGFAREAL
jgi:hypothetical protein